MGRREGQERATLGLACERKNAETCRYARVMNPEEKTVSKDTLLLQNMTASSGSLTGSLTGWLTGSLTVTLTGSMGSLLTGSLAGSKASGACGVAGSDALVKSLGNEVGDCSRGLIPRKIDLLRRGDVPLRGGVFGVQSTFSHKP